VLIDLYRVEISIEIPSFHYTVKTRLLVVVTGKKTGKILVGWVMFLFMETGSLFGMVRSEIEIVFSDLRITSYWKEWTFLEKPFRELELVESGK